MTRTAPPTTTGFAGAYRTLRDAQKPSLGAPLYSRWVNRRLGRVMAAAAFPLGLTPNVVTGISALLSLTGIATLVLVPPSWVTGVAVAVLLSLGYAADSADGQLARLRGGGSPAGEWLDHMVDAAKTPLLHLGVLVAGYRYDWAFGSLARPWLLVPIGFTVVAVSIFFGMTLTEQLRRARGRGGPAGRASLARTLFSIPVDYGLLCVVFVLVGSDLGFVVGYTALFLGTTAYWIVGCGKWFRDMQALAAVPPGSS